MRPHEESSSVGKILLTSAFGSLDGLIPLGKILLAFWVLSQVVLLKQSDAAQLSVDEILRKVSENYQNLQSYRFVAERKDEVRAMGTASSGTGTVTSNFQQSFQFQIELAEVRPSKVRLTVKNDFRELLLVSDGEKTWTCLPKKKKYTEESGPPAQTENQPPSEGRPAAAVLEEYRRLLVTRFRNIWKLTPIATLVGDDRIRVGEGMVDCYVINIRTPQFTQELWVDKGRMIVVRFKQNPLRPTGGIELQKSVSVDIKAASVNSELEGSLFQFTPPEKAKRVDSLDIGDKSW